MPRDCPLAQEARSGVNPLVDIKRNLRAILYTQNALNSKFR
jgi:hypothetical protein